MLVSRSECEGALDSRDALSIRAHEDETGCLNEQDLPQPTRVVKGHREDFGLAQRRQDTPRVARWSERRIQGEAKINGLLLCVALLWQTREGTERLLDIPHSLMIG